MKRIICLAVSLIMMFSCIGVSAQNEISVELNARKMAFDVAPVNINGRVLVPLRTIFEAIGAEVSWNEETKTVISKTDKKTVVMTIGKHEMLTNGEKVKLDVMPMIISGRTMVPARAATEAFGARVLWEAQSSTVKIFTKEYEQKIKEAKTHYSQKVLEEEKNTRSDFTISYFDGYEVRISANDGTDFEIISQASEYFSLLGVRADIYTGPEHPMTEEYAKSIAEGMVSAVSGTLVSTEISYIENEQFIKVHYTEKTTAYGITDNISDVVVYMGIKNGVVYTMRYICCGVVPHNVLADMQYIMNTLTIN